MLAINYQELSAAACTWKQLVDAGSRTDSEAFNTPGLGAQRYFVYGDGSILRWSMRHGSWQVYPDLMSLALAVASKFA